MLVWFCDTGAQISERLTLLQYTVRMIPCEISSSPNVASNPGNHEPGCWHRSTLSVQHSIASQRSLPIKISIQPSPITRGNYSCVEPSKDPCPSIDSHVKTLHEKKKALCPVRGGPATIKSGENIHIDSQERDMRMHEYGNIV